MRKPHINNRYVPPEKPAYVPTPEQIRAACLEIQKEWGDVERRRRVARANRPTAEYRINEDAMGEVA